MSTNWSRFVSGGILRDDVETWIRIQPGRPLDIVGIGVRARQKIRHGDIPVVHVAGVGIARPSMHLVHATAVIRSRRFH